MLVWVLEEVLAENVILESVQNVGHVICDSRNWVISLKPNFLSV